MGAGKYLKLFEKAKTVGQQRHDSIKENMAFYELEQHKLSQYQVDKPWVVDMNTPHATVAIDKRVSSLLSADYTGELDPLSPDDEEIVKNLNKAKNVMWKLMNLDKFITRAIKRGAVAKESYIHITVDDEVVHGGTNRLMTGKLEAHEVRPSNIYIDPEAKELRTASYFCIPMRITKKEARKLLKGKVDDIEDINGGAFDPSERGEIYYGNDYTTEQENVFTKLIIYEREVEKGVPRIYKTVLVEKEIIEERKLMKIKTYPVSQFRWKVKEDSPYGISLMDELLCLQKAVNSVESAATNTAISYAAPAFILRKDAGIDVETFANLIGAPGFVITATGDINNVATTLTKPQIDQNLINMKKDFEFGIQMISGATQEFSGNLGTAGNTTGGANSAIGRAKIIEEMVLENIETFIEDLTNIIVQYLTKAFANETIYSRKKTKQGFEFDETKITEEMAQIEYTFSIEMDKKTKFSKAKDNETLKELFTIERQYDAPTKVINVLDIIESENFANKEELIERYKKLDVQQLKEKANIINEFVNTTSQVGKEFGFNDEMITQGIMEIVRGEETPTVDEMFGVIQKALQSTQQQNTQNL